MGDPVANLWQLYLINVIGPRAHHIVFFGSNGYFSLVFTFELTVSIVLVVLVVHY